MAAAEPGQLLTSRTVHDLVVGSDIAMDDLGTCISSWLVHDTSES
jgi:hypothetical protein